MLTILFRSTTRGGSVPPGIEEMLTARIVVHEMFHMYQLDHWTQITPSGLCAFPLDDDDLLALTRVEHLALSWALTGSNPTAAMEDFLTARLVRYGMAPILRDEEDYNEGNEGMAHFAEGLYAQTAGYEPDTIAQWSDELGKPFDVNGLGRMRL